MPANCVPFSINDKRSSVMQTLALLTHLLSAIVRLLFYSYYYYTMGKYGLMMTKTLASHGNLMIIFSGAINLIKSA